MGRYTKYKGDAESKLVYLVDNLVGGINTEFSDDASSDSDFENLINIDIDQLGTLKKRKGFGELYAISEIFNLLDKQYLPSIKNKTEELNNPELENDNVVYMKLLKNDNNCFRNLSAFSGEKAYRKYQELYGFQGNRFTLLLITVKNNVTTSWLYKCHLPELSYEPDGTTVIDTIEMTCKKETLPVIMNWDRNLLNPETIEFYDKIYFTGNNKGLICFDRTKETYSYSGFSGNGVTNSAYKPTALEITKVGFNVLGDDPLHYVNFQGISTDSIQGIYLCTLDNKPTLYIPNGKKFLLNILYTGPDNGFTLTMKEGENPLTFESKLNSSLSTTGLKVYEITFKNIPTTEVEIKIAKNGATIEPFYDYYEVKQLDAEAKDVVQLNIGNCGICEMYNRAVYYKNDTIWFSDINNFNYVPNYNYITLPIEPTDEITKICYFKNIYVVFTKERIYKLKGSFGSKDFELLPVNMSIGCHAGNTVVPIGNMLYFASPRGLYALKSSEFVEGMTNIKELDIKVKKLTSDYTLYSEELSDPAIRFNGISKRAYALRYRDKYLLFFNSSFEKGDYAAKNNLDVLIYKYDMEAFTTYSFKEKPTFLFVVDSAIESFCTVYNKEGFVDEETLFEYNFDSSSGKTINDLSGNNHNALIKGGARLNIGKGISLNGVNSYVKLPNIPSSLNLLNAFNVNIDLDIKEIVNKDVIFELGQTNESTVIETTSGTINSGNSRYYVILNYQANPILEQNKINVTYTLKFGRRNSNISSKVNNCNILLKEGGNTFINRRFNIDFRSSLEVTLGTGSFMIDHNVSTIYSKTWNLSLSGTSSSTSYYYDKGPNINSSNTSKTEKSWISITVPYTVVAYDGYARVTITRPSVYNSGSLNIGSRTLYVTVNGTVLSFSIPAFTGASKATKTSSESKYIDIKYNSDNFNISVSTRFNIKATLSGSRYENVYGKTFNINMPKIVYTSKVENVPEYADNGSKLVTLNAVNNPSHREVYLRMRGTNSLTFGINSEFGDIVCDLPDNVIHLGENKLSIIIDKNNLNIYSNNSTIYSKQLESYKLVNSVRDACFIGTDRLRSSYAKFNVTKFVSNFGNYPMTEGSGDVVYDVSNGWYARLVNCTWIVETGLTLQEQGYLELPNFSKNTYFTNGFKIEFSGKFKNKREISRIIDLATQYNNLNSANKNCSINVGINGLLMAFNSTSLSYKNMRLEKTDLDITNNHSYMLNCVDNGKGYTLTLSVDGTKVITSSYKYGSISNIDRESNFIGKSNNPNESYLEGVLHTFKFTVYANLNPIKLYRTALYEFETTYDDFGKDIYFELTSKGMNLQYPLHRKKIKSILVKAVGGYNYNEFFFEVYNNGYLANNPRIYKCYVDDSGRVVYDYTENKELKIDENVSLLGNMRLDKTKLGEGVYQTKKIIVRAKGKNFTIRIYGDTSSNFEIESFGYIFKLGKVKED